MNLDANTLRQIVSPAQPGRRARQIEIIDTVGPVLQKVLASYEITTALRAAHFLAQVAHECAAFSTTEEFADGSQYEGRADLGNTHPGDGRRYKGRGLIQLTGRFNYRIFGDRIGQPLEAQPEIAAQPVLSLTIACEYWKDRDLNRYADRDDIITITKLINGLAMHGLQERRNYLMKAKAVLAGTPVASILRLGSTGPAVTDLQRRLGLDPTGNFDDATERTVVAFQRSHGLVNDGIVGPKTMDMLPAIAA